MNSRMPCFSSIALGLVLCTFLTGCPKSFPPAPKGKPGVQADFNVPPPQMVEVINRVLQSSEPPLSVESEKDGVITTSWQRFLGVWRIARRWQEQTRFFITVIPDWTEPTRRCRVLVNQETQQRATEGQEWSPFPEVDRTERAQALLDRIQQAARPTTQP